MKIICNAKLVAGLTEVAIFRYILLKIRLALYLDVENFKIIISVAEVDLLSHFISYNCFYS